MKFSFSLYLTLISEHQNVCPPGISYTVYKAGSRSTSGSLCDWGTAANGAPGWGGAKAALGLSSPFGGCQKGFLELSFCGALKTNVVTNLGVQNDILKRSSRVILNFLHHPGLIVF